MLKRLCCLLLTILCFIPGVSFANDAPSILDKNENLSIDISLKSKEAQIGGTLDFAVTPDQQHLEAGLGLVSFQNIL